MGKTKNYENLGHTVLSVACRQMYQDTSIRKKFRLQLSMDFQEVEKEKARQIQCLADRIRRAHPARL
jgi:hypothetical protein